MADFKTQVYPAKNRSKNNRGQDDPNIERFRLEIIDESDGTKKMRRVPITIKTSEEPSLNALNNKKIESFKAWQSEQTPEFQLDKIVGKPGVSETIPIVKKKTQAEIKKEKLAKKKELQAVKKKSLYAQKVPDSVVKKRESEIAKAEALVLKEQETAAKRIKDAEARVSQAISRVQKIEPQATKPVVENSFKFPEEEEVSYELPNVEATSITSLEKTSSQANMDKNALAERKRLEASLNEKIRDLEKSLSVQKAVNAEQLNQLEIISSEVLKEAARVENAHRLLLRVQGMEIMEGIYPAETKVTQAIREKVRQTKENLKNGKYTETLNQIEKLDDGTVPERRKESIFEFWEVKFERKIMMRGMTQVTYPSLLFNHLVPRTDKNAVGDQQFSWLFTKENDVIPTMTEFKKVSDILETLIKLEEFQDIQRELIPEKFKKRWMKHLDMHLMLINKTWNPVGKNVNRYCYTVAYVNIDVSKDMKDTLKFVVDKDYVSGPNTFKGRVVYASAHIPQLNSFKSKFSGVVADVDGKTNEFYVPMKDFKATIRSLVEVMQIPLSPMKYKEVKLVIREKGKEKVEDEEEKNFGVRSQPMQFVKAGDVKFQLTLNEMQILIDGYYPCLIDIDQSTNNTLEKKTQFLSNRHYKIREHFSKGLAGVQITHERIKSSNIGLMAKKRAAVIKSFGNDYNPREPTKAEMAINFTPITGVDKRAEDFRLKLCLTQGNMAVSKSKGIEHLNKSLKTFNNGAGKYSHGRFVSVLQKGEAGVFIYNVSFRVHWYSKNRQGFKNLERQDVLRTLQVSTPFTAMKSYIGMKVNPDFVGYVTRIKEQVKLIIAQSEKIHEKEEKTRDIGTSRGTKNSEDNINKGRDAKQAQKDYIEDDADKVKVFNSTTKSNEQFEALEVEENESDGERDYADKVDYSATQEEEFREFLRQKQNRQNNNNQNYSIKDQEEKGNRKTRRSRGRGKYRGKAGDYEPP